MFWTWLAFGFWILWIDASYQWSQKLGVSSLLSGLFSGRRERQELHLVARELDQIQASLESGWVPDQEQWDRLKQIPRPWKWMFPQALERLRASGASVLPTLARYQEQIASQEQSFFRARAKVAQAQFQVLICSAMVPLIAVFLYLFFPGLDQYSELWAIATGAVSILNLVGVIWLANMVQFARRGGIPLEKKNWPLFTRCFGESILAQVRAGQPADLAWTQACVDLSAIDQSFSRWVGESVWSKPSVMVEGGGLMQSLRQHLDSMRELIQASLMDGGAMVPRMESAISQNEKEIESICHRELDLIPTRSLKVLFLCVAPGVLGLWIFAMVLHLGQYLA